MKNTSGFKAHAKVFEAFISIIFSLDKSFSPFTESLIEICYEYQDFKSCWQTRKATVDVVYTLIGLLNSDLEPYKNELYEFLKKQRQDK
jgi:hypothetical protein